MSNVDLLRKAYSAVFIAPSGSQNVKEYARRRECLLNVLDAPTFFAGIKREPGTEEDYVQTWTRFVQDPAFLYLTGINQPGCFLLLNPHAKGLEREVLYVPKKDPFKEFWTGLKLGVTETNQEIKTVTGFMSVRPSEDFFDDVKRILEDSKESQVGVYFGPNFKGDHNEKFSKKIQELAALYKKGVKNVAKAHFDLRLPLDSLRINAVRSAEKVTGDAFVECLQSFSSFKTERDLSLALNYAMLRRSDGDLAFPTIVASGENACCLHYVKNDEELKNGKMVLLDFGVRIDSSCSDISRTVPISGKFTPLQKIVYEAVLLAQKFHEKGVKPGAKLCDLDALVWDFLYKELETRFSNISGGFELLYDKKPHGVSHFIGEQVHEASIMGRMLDIELLPGMMISNEPGAYGTFYGTIDGVSYKETFGIRIEDDLLVTEYGCENMSINIPKEVDAIEELMR